MMDENNRNFLLALALSIMVLFTWQAFFSPDTPPPPQQTAQEQPATQPGAPQPGVGAPQAPGAPGVAPAAPSLTPAAPTRDAAISAAPRIPVDTPSLRGSISLRGARIDDLVLKQFNVSVSPSSENVTLLSPSGSPRPYYAEHGWTVAPADGVKSAGLLRLHRADSARSH
jgi:YidC/Oxa1 family membrane protein insertase